MELKFKKLQVDKNNIKPRNRIKKYIFAKKRKGKVKHLKFWLDVCKWGKCWTVKRGCVLIQMLSVTLNLNQVVDTWMFTGKDARNL